MALRNDPITVYASHLIKEWERTHSLRELSRRSGITPTQLGDIRERTKGVGMKTIRGLVRAFGMTIDDFETQAKGDGKRTFEVIEPDLTGAMAFARLIKISDEAIEAAKEHGKNHKLNAEEWLMWMKVWQLNNPKPDKPKKG